MKQLASNVLEMPIERGVARVTEALTAKGFDVVAGLRMHNRKRAGGGSRRGAVRALGVSNAFASVDAQHGSPGTPLRWNVFLSEIGPSSTRVSSVDPLSARSSLAFSVDERARGVRRELSRIIAEL